MLKLYNTMSRTQEKFKPRNTGSVKIFTCGPSVYRRPHIGNYRTFMYEDILVKYLEFVGHSVERAIPLTDIEDKTILEAVKNNKKIEEITGDVVKKFKSETAALQIRLPQETQRSSLCVECAVDLIQSLIKKGFAYQYGRDIFFDPLKYKEFGKLFRLDMSRWPTKKVRFKKDTYIGNRWNLGDFILWHGYRTGDISWWDTDIGKGRPSWNIQDPSVILKHLGPEIDINCGGIDNIYRHHDYNIAILESMSGKKFARYYLHGEHLIVEGKTMSKSKGNIIYPEDIYSKGYTPRHLRFFLFYTHYRKKLNYTEDRFADSSVRLDQFRSMIHRLTRKTKASGKANKDIDSLIQGLSAEFQETINNDLAAGEAFDRISSIVKRLDNLNTGSPLVPGQKQELKDILKNIDQVLCVIF